MKQLQAVMTALVTPFKDGKVDFASLEKLVEHQLKNQIEGFVVNGTTAESPTLTRAEVQEIFKKIRAQVGPKFHLVMGTGSNNTAETVEFSKQAQAWGADSVLVVVPYYNKPPQRGLVQHFKAVAQAVSIPVLLYNVPGRTITALSLESIQELSQVKNIAGIKEASGNIDFVRAIAKGTSREFVLLSGDDATYVDFLKAGGHGVISVASHVIPEEMVRWRKQAVEGHAETAATELKKYLPLMDHLFVEANPIPVKMALYQMGLIASPEMRLPLTTMAESLAEKMKQEMRHVGVLR